MSRGIGVYFVELLQNYISWSGKVKLGVQFRYREGYSAVANPEKRYQPQIFGYDAINSENDKLRKVTVFWAK